MISEVSRQFDPEEVERAELEQESSKLKATNAAADLKAVLNTAEGRRVIWRYIAAGNIYDAGYEGSGSLTYFKQGKRAIAVALLTDALAANPEAILSMMKSAPAKEDK